MDFFTVYLPIAGLEYFRAVVPSPHFADDGALYVLSEYNLWRTGDRGATWARWEDPRLEGRTSCSTLSRAARPSASP